MVGWMCAARMVILQLVTEHFGPKTLRHGDTSALLKCPDTSALGTKVSRDTSARGRSVLGPKCPVTLQLSWIDVGFLVAIN